MRDGLNLRHLTFFKAVAETSSFTAAAERCGVSQPGLSAAIKEFEADLGVRLFDRDTRNVGLTKAGEALLPLVEVTLANAAIASRDIRERVTSGRTNIRIASVSSITSFLLPHALALDGEMADTRIEISDVQNFEVTERVMSGNADIGIGLGPFDATVFEADFLFSDQLTAVVSQTHPLAQMRELTWSEVGLEKIVAYREGSHVYQMIETTLATQGILFAPQATYHFRQSLFGVALSGQAITILPSLSLNRTMPPGLVEIPIADPIVSRQYFIVSRRHRAMTGEARRLRRFLLEQLTRSADF